MGSLFEKLLRKQSLARWKRLADQAANQDLVRLRKTRANARELRAQIDRLLHVADGRLALPQIGSGKFSLPHGTDWSWRPELWRGPLPVPGVSSAPPKSKLGKEVQLFHDCAYSELTLRQIRNQREEDVAPFGLRMDVFNFDGSFLSLVIAMPDEVANGLTRQHLIRIESQIETEKPIEIFARLNIRHGPNTEQIVRELPLQKGRIMVEYDLGYSRLNEKRIEAVWLDLIFEAPDMNQVILRDITFARLRRANL